MLCRAAIAFLGIGLACGAAACDDDPVQPAFGPATIPGSLSPDDAAHSDRFGGSIAVLGDLMVVGSPGADLGGPDSGAVRIYQRSGVTFTELAQLTRPDAGDDERGAWGDRFGAAVAIAPAGDLVAVGAPGVDFEDQAQDLAAIDAGAIYIFQGSGAAWTPVATLRSPAPFADQRFGASVAVTADTLIAGAPGVDFDRRDVGAVIVFERSGTEFAVATDIGAGVR